MYEKYPLAVILGGFVILFLAANFYDDGGVTAGGVFRGVGAGLVLGIFWVVPVIIIIEIIRGFFSKEK